MSELQLAPTIRTPRPDEVPQHKDILDNIQRRQIANIVEGFTLRENASHEQPFTFYCEINIDNSKLWRLFQAFLLQFPDEVYFIYSHKDTDSPICTSYKDKFEILNILSPYETELMQDGLLKFGIAFHTNDYFEEIFIMPAKYIQYWGVNPEPFGRIMQDFSLNQIDDLNFIDEFPLVTESLQLHNVNTIPTDDLLNRFDDIFRPKT
ncbi:hypothetical protein Q4E93_34115 [Flavitalea sp. BT771]|uniref:hypothetical protein n=1 Tax=Flavitalea sp. BT771 TaxID=3063329 RepID=UPI0026E3DC06|nr:hypothetical protein [Flavitalea sp. BT771]MDO6435700.1 hypothetical protein [Flavitalea sp. BT771]MDV6224601.1 hypothetical protein [Flavitalea sp. BT771]